MSDYTQQRLEALARQYGCLYGGKPKIGGLLAHIADGQLTLNKEVPYISTEPSLPLLKLRLWLPVHLRGMFACIARTIADYQGNIFQAEAASEVDRRGVASILFSMPEDGNLKDLIDALQKLCIRDVEGFNNKREILNANIYLEGDTIDDNLGEPSESGLGTDRNRLVERIYSRQLLRKISCTIALRIVARNQIGVLAKVTRAIAEQGFFVAQVRQEFNAKDNLDIIELLISLEENSLSQMSQEIEKIKTIANTLEKIPEIKDVQRLGTDRIWNVRAI